jgi:O-antigen ligase
VAPIDKDERSTAQLGQRVALLGLFIYVIFAPHSVAASTVGVAIATLGWIFRTLITRSVGLRRSKFDLIILLSVVWTVISSVVSTEPGISIPKLTALWCVLLFYLTRAVVEKRTAVTLVAVLILSGTAGVLFSAFDLIRGRGVIVESIDPRSPLKQIDVFPGDAIWRFAGNRIYSVAELDEAIRTAPTDRPSTVSLISQGEHVERLVALSAEAQRVEAPSGIIGSSRTHRFRASGWTRHYETFSELLQIIAQLALGLALANLRNHGANKLFKLALLAAAIVGVGIAFTAMRTVLVAFVIGASLIAWRSLRGIPKVVFTAALFLVLGFGAVVVWQTRGDNAVALGDPSSSLRARVARNGVSRILVHPVFGHGMDAMHVHWSEWGFPGRDMLHLHSTPLQLAFDRGVPMLLLWLWMMGAFWLKLWKDTSIASELSDTNWYGIVLGASGALTGMLASSIVNYNYGDSEVAMMFWWLMGVVNLESRIANRES